MQEPPREHRQPICYNNHWVNWINEKHEKAKYFVFIVEFERRKLNHGKLY